MKENLLFAERFIRTLKNKIYIYITSISKNVYIDKLDDKDNKYNNTYHRAIKMKPVDVKSSIDFNKENNKEGPKFKVGDNVRISKYQNIFPKGCIPNWSENFFLLGKLKILLGGHMLLVILKAKKLLEHFMKKNCKKQIKKNLELKK